MMSVNRHRTDLANGVSPRRHSAHLATTGLTAKLRQQARRTPVAVSTPQRGAGPSASRSLARVGDRTLGKLSWVERRTGAPSHLARTLRRCELYQMGNVCRKV